MGDLFLSRISRSGWGRILFSNGQLHRVENFHKIEPEKRGSSGLPIGLGRSYGDSSLNSNGILWTCESLKDIDIDTASSIATCGSGVTIGELEREASLKGLFPPVVPGTEFVTVGGAIASDVHGKSHHAFGSFGDHLTEILLIDAKGNLRCLKPEGENEDLFWATVGGMGLTGIILSAKIKLRQIETTYFTCKEFRVKTISEALEKLLHLDKEFEYTVAWIDFSGKYNGRGLVSGGNHTRISELNSVSNKKAIVEKKPKKISLPDVFPSNLVNKFTVRLFNEFWYRKPLNSGIKHFQGFLHPLDSIQNWNRIYGKFGLLQYQFQIPENNEDFLFKVMEKFKSIKATSFLVVLKKFGSSNRGMLSFPKAGWTLAIDLPANLIGLENCLAELDDELAQLGGRIYLSKDHRLSKENFQKMYPHYEKFKQLKRDVDPESYWNSDQGRRLGLC